MKKIKIAIISVLMFAILCSVVYAYNEIIANRVDYKIYLNGQPLDCSNLLLSYEDTTYLPIRAFVTMLGMDVEWDAQEKSIEITDNSNDVFTKLNKEELSAILPFMDIREGDKLEDVFEIVGTVSDTGSGMFIYQYTISEDVNVVISSFDNQTVWRVTLHVGEAAYELVEPRATDEAPQIKIAIFPSSGPGSTGTYFFTLDQNGTLKVEQGTPESSELTQDSDMRRGGNYRYEAKKKRLTSAEVDQILASADKVFEEAPGLEYYEIDDSWDIKIFYQGEEITLNCWDSKSQFVEELVDVLKSVSPVEVDLRGFA